MVQTPRLPGVMLLSLRHRKLELDRLLLGSSNEKRKYASNDCGGSQALSVELIVICENGDDGRLH